MKLGLEEFAWYQKYRPVTIDGVILPETTKDIFRGIVKQGEIDQDYLLSGRSGIGKTTIALTLSNELGLEHYFINSSLKGNISTLRHEISDYASSASFDGKRKLVILDEADNLTHDTQLALRAFMEEFSSNCSFILTCNYANRIIEGLHSRCSMIEFKISEKDKNDILKQYIIRCMQILKKENVDFENEAVALLLKELLPDFRRTLNALQKYSKIGKIDVGVIASLKDDDAIKLISFVKNKNLQQIKKWLFDHQDIEFNKLSDDIYRLMPNYITDESIRNLILVLAEYDYKSAFVINKLINTEAMMIQISNEVKFK